MMTVAEFNDCFEYAVDHLADPNGLITDIDLEEKKIVLTLFTGEKATATVTFYPEMDLYDFKRKNASGDEIRFSFRDPVSQSFKDTLWDLAENTNRSHYVLEYILEGVNRHLSANYKITDIGGTLFGLNDKWYHFEKVKEVPPVANSASGMTPYVNKAKIMDVLKPAFRNAVIGFVDESVITETATMIGTTFPLVSSSYIHVSFRRGVDTIELRLVNLEDGLRRTFGIFYENVDDIPRLVKSVVYFIKSHKSIKISETDDDSAFVNDTPFDYLIRTLDEYIPFIVRNRENNSKTNE